MEAGRQLGFLGPGPLEAQLRHASGFARIIDDEERRWARRDGDQAPRGKLHVLDLGSGGGVPGLALAALLETAEVTLLDSNRRRCAHLRRVVAAMGVIDRVEVVEARAEDVGRDPLRRGRYQVVTARSFGPPAVTAECAAPLLTVGGLLITSEPPGAPSGRWSGDGLSLLGMGGSRPRQDEFAYQIVVQELRCPDRFPRRVGVPAKRPLF